MNPSTSPSSNDSRDRRYPVQRASESMALGAEDEPKLAEYRDILIDHRWLIAGVIGLALVLSVLYVTLATPIYRANLLIQIEDSPPESKSFLTGTTGLGDLKTTATGELQILGSRMVLGAAVDQVGLQINAQPRYLPVFGAWLARRADELSDPGFLGLGGYVSGNEQIVVKRFSVPASMEDAEDPFVVTSLGDGRYTVTHELLDAPLEGMVGMVLQKKVADGTVDIELAELAGKAGAQFTVAVASRFRAIERLQDRLLMAEQGRLSNVVNVSLEDGNRNRLGATLNAIADQYVRQNSDRKSAEADKTLAFLNTQLPIFERQLKASEDAFARFRNTNGTIDFDDEAKVWLKSTAELQTTLLDLQQRRLDLDRTLNADHPRVKTVNQQIAAVQAQLGSLNKRITAMPNVQRDALRLERDVHANTAQYQSMQNNALQMRLVREGKIGNVRVLDKAVVSKVPVKPQKSLIVAFALLLGAMIGPAWAIFRTRSKSGIQDPDEVAAQTGLELYGVVPQSPEQRLVDAKKSKAEPAKILADLHPHSGSVEAIRAMRVGLKGAMNAAPDNRILITGATPGVGKSFIAANFAMLLAHTGKRVLLINADLRKGGEIGDFGLAQAGGLAEVIAGQLRPEAAIHAGVRPNLDVMTSGKLPRFPSDLFESKSFANLLGELSPRYDHVIIDTAPVLVAADAVAVAPLCGLVLMVARAEVSQLRELKESIRRLVQASGSVDGLLLNDMDLSRRYNGSYGYSHGAYPYARQNYSAPAN